MKDWKRIKQTYGVELSIITILPIMAITIFLGFYLFGFWGGVIAIAINYFGWGNYTA